MKISHFLYLIKYGLKTIIFHEKKPVIGCIDIPGLCERCGFFYVAEYSLLFHGNRKVVLETLKTYLKYI